MECCLSIRVMSGCYDLLFIQKTPVIIDDEVVNVSKTLARGKSGYMCGKNAVLNLCHLVQGTKIYEEINPSK